MFSATDFTEPSTKAEITPLGCFDLNAQVTAQLMTKRALSPEGLVVVRQQERTKAGALTLSILHLMGRAVCPRRMWLLPDGHPGAVPGKGIGSKTSGSVSPIARVLEVPSVTSARRMIAPRRDIIPTVSPVTVVEPQEWLGP